LFYFVFRIHSNSRYPDRNELILHELFKLNKMSSNLMHSEIDIDMLPMDYNDEEETGKTAHHNITVELKEVKTAYITKHIRTHSI